MPRRRCVGCGRVAPKPELVRIAAARADGGRSRRAVLDRAGTMRGRGAYVCRRGVATDDLPSSVSPSAECLALAGRRGGIARALRCSVTIDAELVGIPSELVESVSR